jgi:hypothetical protein
MLFAMGFEFARFFRMTVVNCDVIAVISNVQRQVLAHDSQSNEANVCRYSLHGTSISTELADCDGATKPP